MPELKEPDPQTPPDVLKAWLTSWDHDTTPEMIQYRMAIVDEDYNRAISLSPKQRSRILDVPTLVGLGDEHEGHVYEVLLGAPLPEPYWSSSKGHRFNPRLTAQCSCGWRAKSWCSLPDNSFAAWLTHAGLLNAKR